LGGLQPVLVLVHEAFKGLAGLNEYPSSSLRACANLYLN